MKNDETAGDIYDKYNLKKINTGICKEPATDQLNNRTATKNINVQSMERKPKDVLPRTL